MSFIQITGKNISDIKNGNIFFISTPLQLLNAIEAHRFFKTKNNVLVILNFGNIESDLKQIKKLIHLFLYDSLIEFNVENLKRHHSKTVCLINEIRKSRYEKLFTGYFSANYRRILCNVQSKDYYLIDDGTYTISLHNEIYNNNEKSCILIRRYSEKKKKGLFKKIRFFFYDRYRELYFKIHGYRNDFSHYKILKFYTIFKIKPFEKEIIIYHHFNYLKEIYSKQTPKTSYKDSVFFLGQPIEKIWHISNQEYLSLIVKIYNYYQKMGLNFIYIPHRSEKKNLLAELNNTKINLLHTNTPFEFFLLHNKIQPYRVASFFSSTLFTLKCLYDEVVLEAFKFDFDENKHTDIAAIYNLMRVEKINIHTIEYSRQYDA